jgi:hydroxyethylthiazole kinase-like uncharacterized protein yjeF
VKHAHSVAAVRAAEAAAMAGLPDGALMDRAATGLATVCLGLLGRAYGARVVLLVGSGDNGGDALYGGARLAERGAGVDALLLDPQRAHPGGLAALRRAGGRVADDPAVLDRADLVLDGIVGIGGAGGLRPAAAELAARAGRAPGLLVAVDLPSGVDADTGEVSGPAVRADATVTFGTWKPGLLVDPGAGLAGATTCIDIGLAAHLPEATLTSLQAADVAALLPTPDRAADKYRRGVLGVVAGSPAYVGAAVLAVGGALAAGAGMVRFVGPATVAEAVRARHPEVVVTDGLPSAAGRVQAWVVGPGGGTDETARAVLTDVLRTDVPVLVDADALSLLAQHGELRRRAGTLLTPHAGELARLLGGAREDVEAHRLAHVRRAAARYGATVLLKGSTTLIAGPGPGPIRVNGTGTGWLATAGSGDVLSGVCGALLAAGLPADLAGALGAHLHGLAARLAAGSGAPITAGRIAELLPGAWRSITPADPAWR